MKRWRHSLLLSMWGFSMSNYRREIKLLRRRLRDSRKCSAETLLTTMPVDDFVRMFSRESLGYAARKRYLQHAGTPPRESARLARESMR